MNDDHTLEDIEALINGVEDDEEIEDEEVHEEETDEEEAPPAEEDDEDEPEAEAPAPDDEEEDDWELKAKKIQAAKDREVAELRKELQSLREAQAEARGREQARKELGEQEQHSQLASVTEEDLKYGIETNLPGTFQWTVLNRPDLVPGLISMVRSHERGGNEVADRMVIEYADYKAELARQASEEKWETVRQEREAEQAPLRSQEAMHEVVESLTERFGETFEAAKDEINQRLQTDGREYIQYLADEAAKDGEDFQVTPELMRDIMVDIYLEIRENALNEKAMQPSKPEKVPAGAKALGQSATDNRPEDEQDFLDSFINGAREADMNIDPSFLP